MRLRMKAVLWDALKLDDTQRYSIALSCFYLGRGVEETRDLLRRNQDDSEVKFVLETAAFSGLDPINDVILKVL